MSVKVIFFGQLVDITGVNELTVDDIHETDRLIDRMQELYPGLKDMNYTFAVDKVLMSGNTSLKQNSTVAFMPPFSGG